MIWVLYALIFKIHDMIEKDLSMKYVGVHAPSSKYITGHKMSQPFINKLKGANQGCVARGLSI